MQEKRKTYGFEASDRSVFHTVFLNNLGRLNFAYLVNEIL